jgi:hypothetical protein
MSEPEALRARRSLLLERIGQAADEIAVIDSRLKAAGDDND